MCNGFADIANSTIQMSFDSISTLQQVGDYNNALTSSMQELSYLWTTDPDTAIANTMPAAGSGNSSTMQTWITNNLTGPTALNYSSAFITEVMSRYFACEPSSTSQSYSAELGFLNNVANLINAAAQSDEQPLQNSISTMSTMSQHFETDQGPFSSTGQLVTDGLGNYASALQSIAA